MSHRRPLGPMLVLLIALALLVPTAGTVAYFTSEDSAEQTDAGAGRWCSVPSPEEYSNVYRLADMPTHNFPSGSNTQMSIVPVVNNGEFEPRVGEGDGSGRLGVRLWACDSDSLDANSEVKVTAWSNRDFSDSDMVWLAPAGDGIAGQRLDPTEGFGWDDPARLHRQGSNATVGITVGGDARHAYTWLVSAGRNRENPEDRRPSCTLWSACTLQLNPGPDFGEAFNPDLGAGRTHDNSVRYLGETYRGSSRFNVQTQPTHLNAFDGDIASDDAEQVQWVVMEWWGGTQPTDDMAIEVFVE